MFGGKGDLLKVFRGAYDYLRGGKIYAEESFEVFKSTKEQFYRIEAKVLGRVSTGETLCINVEYETNLKWVPRIITVSKVLGNQESHEAFLYDARGGKLLYTFKGVESEGTDEITVGSKFAVITPAASTCLMFIKSKKMNTTSKNSYNIIVSTNDWKYLKTPEPQGMSFERVSSNKETIRLGGANLQAYKYKFGEENLNEPNSSSSKKKRPFIEVHLSKHIAIPYMIKTPGFEEDDLSEQTKIQIKYLNELEEGA